LAEHFSVNLCESRIYGKGKKYLINIRKLVAVVAGTKIDEDDDKTNGESCFSQGIIELSSCMKLEAKVIL